MRATSILVTIGALTLGVAFAQAADLRPITKAPPPVTVPAQFDWTGFYVGGHVGALRGRADLDSVRDVVFPGFVTLNGIPALAPIVIVPSRFAVLGGVSSTDTDFTGGGQIGYNWQIGSFLFGLEGDASWTNVKVALRQNVEDPFFIQTLVGTYTAQIDWTATIRARVGATFDRWMLYVTGGAAFVGGEFNSTFTLTNPITGIFFPTPFEGTMTGNSKFSRVGWTIGAGFEWAFTNSWSLAGEYRYTDYGNFGVTFAGTDPAAATSGLGIVPYSTTMRLKTDTATLRLNYRFAPAPVMARY